MDSSLTALLMFFDARRAAAEPLVLATIVATSGSTYRKAGARMLIDRDGTACGLLSGGCLEADLLERARAVIASGEPQLVEYDLRTSDDPIWGLGLGCEGAMSILLQRVSATDDFRPLNRIVELAHTRRPARFATVVRSTSATWPAGTCLFEEDPVTEPLGRAIRERLASDGSVPATGVVEVSADDGVASVYLGQIDSPPHILVLGGGPDAGPVVRAASDLGWRVSVYDHRAAYATSRHFPTAIEVVAAPTAELAARVDLSRYDAAVVMSHHLPSDLDYLRQLASTRIRYVGLLGPRERRRRLFDELGGAVTAALAERIHGPVGLDIGARTPEAIALAIVAEIHAVLAGRDGRSYSALHNESGPWIQSTARDISR